MSWKVDNAHTSLEFSARHMMVSTVKGHFNEFVGEVDIDPEDLTRSWATAVIQAKSLDTREERRDTHLRSADFFDVEKFPEITYRSGKIERRGENRFRVAGELTIKGVTRPIELDVEFLGMGTSPYGVKVAGFEASGTLSRKDFDLNWNVALETGGWLVGDEIKLRVDAEANEEVQAEAGAETATA
ncbi:MAG TPA: YceI family protein [Candidatus Dormibacteraeota bacterium]|nr:YceI family protein [Candidatus Dormibacteraeota bacterium]